MNLLALLASAALAHVNMPINLVGQAGLQFTIGCELTGPNGRTGTLTGSAMRRETLTCLDPHDFRETITASFNDGMGTVNCAPVTINMYEPAYHYRSDCQAVFTYNSGPRTCTSECRNMPWLNTTTQKPTAFPNPLRVKEIDAMRFINFNGGARVRIYSMTGRLVYEGLAGGDGSMHWHLEDKSGRKVGSGVYLVVAETAKGVQKLKVAVQR